MIQKSIYIGFSVENIQFAIDAKYVVEVIDGACAKNVAIPKTEYIAGMINYSGHLLPLIEIRNKIDIETRTDSPSKATIILQIELSKENFIYAASIDAVTDIFEAFEHEILPISFSTSQIDSNQLIDGEITRQYQNVLIIDPKKLFLSKKITNKELSLSRSIF